MLVIGLDLTGMGHKRWSGQWSKRSISLPLRTRTDLDAHEIAGLGSITSAPFPRQVQRTCWRDRRAHPYRSGYVEIRCPLLGCVANARATFQALVDRIFHPSWLVSFDFGASVAITILAVILLPPTVVAEPFGLVVGVRYWLASRHRRSRRNTTKVF